MYHYNDRVDYSTLGQQLEVGPWAFNFKDVCGQIAILPLRKKNKDRFQDHYYTQVKSDVNIVLALAAQKLAAQKAKSAKRKRKRKRRLVHTLGIAPAAS